MTFEAEAFISYAHIDNVALEPGSAGWVANLERALQIRLTQRLGKQCRVWRDNRLQGNEAFDETLVERLRHVAALVAVLSQGFINSDWTRKELAAFCDAAKAQGGLKINDKVRLFKVLKTAVPLDQHPPELRSMLGYEFYKVDASGKVREMLDIFGPEAKSDFWLKLDDLASDLSSLIEVIGTSSRTDAPPPEVSAAPCAIYLAVTTMDLRDERDVIKRGLEQHGHRVLPDRPVPTESAEVEAFVADALARSRMSIHLVGSTYSFVPEGGQRSLIEIQNELAIARAGTGAFSRLVWMPPDLEVSDVRQQKVIDGLRMDSRAATAADVLETPLANLRTQIAAWLQDEGKVATDAAPAASPEAGTRELYLIYDKRDAEAIGPWADHFFKEFEVIRSVFEGDEAEVRAFHDETLRHCSGALIFYGAGSGMWLQRKLREIRKSAGYGRTTPPPVVGVCLIGPRTAEKEAFRTHDALLLPQWDGLAPEALAPFVSAVKDPARRA
jgi:hypothetical protein